MGRGDTVTDLTDDGIDEGKDLLGELGGIPDTWRSFPDHSADATDLCARVTARPKWQQPAGHSLARQDLFPRHLAGTQGTLRATNGSSPRKAGGLRQSRFGQHRKADRQRWSTTCRTRQLAMCNRPKMSRAIRSL